MLGFYTGISGIICYSIKSLNVKLRLDEAFLKKCVVEKLEQRFILKGWWAVVGGISFFPGWQNSFSLFLSGFSCCPQPPLNVVPGSMAAMLMPRRGRVRRSNSWSGSYHCCADLWNQTYRDLFKGVVTHRCQSESEPWAVVTVAPQQSWFLRKSDFVNQ